MKLDAELENLVRNGKMKSGNNYGAGVILVHPNTGEILIAKRTDTKNYCTPGGKIEVGETPLQGAVRETLEESGIQVNSLILYDVAMHTADNGKNWTSFMFITDDFTGEPKNQESEVEPWEWMYVDEALIKDLFPPTKKSLERAIEYGLLGSRAKNIKDSQLEVSNPDYIPYVEMPTSPFNDSLICAYSCI